MTVSIRYIVNDVQASIEFYCDKLGFEVDMNPAPGFARLSRGDLHLLINAPGAGGAGRAGGDPAPGGWNRFQVEADNLDDFVADMQEQDVSFRGDTVEGAGGRQILVEDPSGNLVEIFESTR